MSINQVVARGEGPVQKWTATVRDRRFEAACHVVDTLRQLPAKLHNFPDAVATERIRIVLDLYYLNMQCTLI